MDARTFLTPYRYKRIEVQVFLSSAPDLSLFLISDVPPRLSPSRLMRLLS